MKEDVEEGPGTEERRIAGILENVSEAVVVFDPRWRYVYVNAAAERLIGRRREELLGRDARMLFSAAHETFFRHFERAMVEQTSVSFEEYYGPLSMWVEVRAFPSPAGLSVFFHDGTDRRRAEDELRKSREDLARAQSVGNIGSWRLDVRKNELTWSDENHRIFGIPKGAAMTYETFLSIVHPDDRAYVDTQWKAGLAGSPYDIEHRIVADGQIKWVREKAYLEFDKNGELLGGFGITQDITARKQAEEQRVKMERQLLQAQRLESLGVLAGGVAHDFNNLLTVVLGNADLALDELPPMAPAGENIRRIVTASHRAAELCRQMLAYAGKGQLVRETIDLHGLVEEMVSLLKASISKKALLTLNLEEDLPPMTGDPTQVRQILMNLVINASEAIGEGGVIKVAAGVMEYAGESPTGPNFETNGGEDLPPGRYLCLEVSDTGRGMDRATMERLFEPFFTTKFTGRGLGLSAVLGIVRAHKGAVKVCSEPGRGTTVKVLFPLLESEGAEEGNVQASGALDDWRGSGTVLLVDDEEAVRGVGGQMLQRLGFDVLIAADGREALDLYRQRHAEICLVMLDLNMPHMDGEEAYRELRRIDPEAQVVLASGYSEIDVASRFAGRGLAGVMQKPYTLVNLRTLLSSLLHPAGSVE